MLTIYHDFNSNILELYNKGFSFHIEPERNMLMIKIEKFNHTIKCQKTVPAEHIKSMFTDDGINLILQQIMQNINNKIESSS